MSPRKVAKPPVDDDDMPPLSAADLAKFRPASELVPHIVARAKRGRPKAEAPKVAISIRLDSNVVEALRELGPGWQTEANRVLSSFVAKGAEKKRVAYSVTRNAAAGEFVKRKNPAAGGGRKGGVNSR